MCDSLAPILALHPFTCTDVTVNQAAEITPVCSECVWLGTLVWLQFFSHCEFPVGLSD